MKYIPNLHTHARILNVDRPLPIILGYMNGNVVLALSWNESEAIETLNSICPDVELLHPGWDAEGLGLLFVPARAIDALLTETDYERVCAMEEADQRMGF